MLNIARAIRRAKYTSEAGLGLVEVLVAIVLITIVAAASATLVINGVATGATVERRQVAVTVASGAMESVSAQSVATASTGVSGLYTGRTYAALHAAWTANSAAAGIPQTYEVWDSTATASSSPAVPITSSTVQAGTTYKVATLIGSCYQPSNGGNCAKAPGYLGDAPPATVPANYTILIRVVVIVTWSAGKGCSGFACSYVTSTLVDPHIDLDWVTHA
ncbi:MAG: hypothetical protein ABI632_03365 [Pseudolysinimonas sp.]